MKNRPAATRTTATPLSAAVASAAIALSALTGCNQQAAPPTAGTQAAPRGLAVIDLDAVASGLGSDKQILRAIQQRQTLLNEKLTELANAYIEQLEQHSKGPKAEATSEVQLAQYQQQANQSLGDARRKAQQDLSRHRSRMVQQFREAVRPIAREVATERGYAVIVTKQDSLLFDYTPEADITQAVLARLRKPAPTHSKPAPAKPGPAGSGPAER